MRNKCQTGIQERLEEEWDNTTSPQILNCLCVGVMVRIIGSKESFLFVYVFFFVYL